MGSFRKNKKTASMARGRIDKAQNQLLKSMKKDIDELKSDVEAKYNVSIGKDLVDSYDGSTDATRLRGILSVPTGENQGTTDVTRVGDSVSLKHIDFNYNIYMPFSRTTETVQEVTNCRVIMFWDNQPNAITTAGAVNINKVYWPQLLQNAKLGVTTIDLQKLIPLSEKDWDNRKRFSFIYDKVHTFACSYSPGQSQPSATTDGGNGPRSATGVIRFNKNYKNQKIRYTAGGSIPQNRQLYMGFISDAAAQDSPSVVSRRPVLTYSVRTIYDDL